MIIQCLSNDIEPTSLTECGYVRPGDSGCGGWGFYYLNLLAATLDLYRNAENTFTSLLLHSFARFQFHHFLHSFDAGKPYCWSQDHGVVRIAVMVYYGGATHNVPRVH